MVILEVHGADRQVFDHGQKVFGLRTKFVRLSAISHIGYIQRLSGFFKSPLDGAAGEFASRAKPQF